MAQSEERFRDLFDEAPIAYVHQGIDTRIIRANRTAMKILGVTPEEIIGILATSFIPDTPEEAVPVTVLAAIPAWAVTYVR